jgi:hypothetical protein
MAAPKTSNLGPDQAVGPDGKIYTKPTHIDAATGKYAPKLATKPSPCPGPKCYTDQPPAPKAKGRRVVYLNFTGPTLTRSVSTDDATQDKSAMIKQSMDVTPFSASALNHDGGGTTQQIIDATVEQLEDSYSGIDVEFTTTRPGSGSYSMIVFAGSGHTCENTIEDSPSCVGIALRDCGDLYFPSNIVFVFTWGTRWNDLAQVAAHEGGHAFGLDHILNSSAIMYPSVQGSFIPTDFLSGTIPGEDQPDACGGDTFQDSRERLLNNIGPTGQDVEAPDIEITSPENGAVVVGGTQVTANITDNRAVLEAEMLIDNQPIEKKLNPPWTFTVPSGLPGGDHLLAVTATDESNNTSQKTISVTVEGNPSCSSDGDCAEGWVCIDSACVPAGPAAGNLGAFCSQAEECDSGACGTLEGESRCTQACDPASPCPIGFECVGGGACWPASGDGGGGGGCAIGGRNKTGPLLLMLFVGAALLFSRRRS